MLSEKNAVAAELRERVLKGFKPTRDSESANDHWADWTVLAPEEFEEIKQSALRELAARGPTRKPFDIPLSTPVQVRLLLLALLESLPADDIPRVTRLLQQWGVDATEAEILGIHQWLNGVLKHEIIRR